MDVFQSWMPQTPLAQHVDTAYWNACDFRHRSFLSWAREFRVGHQIRQAFCARACLEGIGQASLGGGFVSCFTSSNGGFDVMLVYRYFLLADGRKLLRIHDVIKGGQGGAFRGDVRFCASVFRDLVE